MRTPADAISQEDDAAKRPGALRAYVKLARPAQWIKSGFVLVGPVYGLAACLEGGRDPAGIAAAALLAALAFALASSASYALNDARDAQADRDHPRKRHRPIAAGLISPGQARAFAVLLFGAAGIVTAFIPEPPVGTLASAGGLAPGFDFPLGVRPIVAALLALYVVNVIAYSYTLKHRVIADVVSLSLGFVLRVLAGCAAAGIAPSTWLLNVTLFAAMFLAFGKRLGERRSAAASGELERMLRHRRVQQRYTDELLRMATVVTGVATLLTYALYVQEQDVYTLGINLLWLTLIPATYALLRAIVLVESAAYDDPTELAVHDRPFQLACLAFGAITATLLLWRVQAPLA